VVTGTSPWPDRAQGPLGAVPAGVDPVEPDEPVDPVEPDDPVEPVEPDDDFDDFDDDLVDDPYLEDFDDFDPCLDQGSGTLPARPRRPGDGNPTTGARSS
jgi:hypothetical protein